MLVPPEFYNGEIELDLDNAVFKVESEKILDMYKKNILNDLFDNEYFKNDKNLINARKLDNKFKELKKDRLIKKGYTLQSLTIMLTISVLYFTCKGLMEHFKNSKWEKELLSKLNSEEKQKAEHILKVQKAILKSQGQKVYVKIKNSIS
ncbi:hypothetical protein PFHG_04206 [Plasmodium falciparum HB3]|uniref:Uncharacterized protein n=1 Tax=Plasmodium falciparum (isolate HB3) TaxID=137071 RepID=A0A0L7KH99_PLAFX|nr:hypothetical protein PFHG_04206 [Plasmodium falciparum HB3]